MIATDNKFTESSDTNKVITSSSLKRVIVVLSILTIVFSGVILLDFLKVVSLNEVLHPFQLIGKDKVSVGSQVNGVLISITDDEELNKYLDEVGLFKFENVRIMGTLKNVSVKKLHIVLTPEVQKEYPMNNVEGELRFGISTVYNSRNSVLTLKIYQSPEHLSSRDGESLSKIINAHTFYVIYSLTHKLPRNNPFQASQILRDQGLRVQKEGVVFKIQKI